MKPKRPLVCPTLEWCERNVSEGTAEHICHGVWEECECNQHLVVKKKPREWTFEEVKA